MTRHAGFAFVASFAESVVNDLLGTYVTAFVQPIQIPLPPSVPVGGQQVALNGTLALLPPTVTLRSRADNRVTAHISAAGGLSVGGGPGGPPLENYEVIVTFDVDVGLTTVLDNNGRLVGGLDNSQATVDAISVSTLSGAPLSQIASASITSGPVLAALTATLRAIPASKLAATLPTFAPSFSRTVVDPLLQRTDFWDGQGPVNPPPLPPPRNLFSFTIALGRVVVRPVDGAIVVAADLVGYTNGDPGALQDLNRVPAPVRYTLLLPQDSGPVFNGGFAPGAPLQPHNTHVATIVNGDVLNQIVARELSPQMAGKYVDRHVEIRALGLGLGEFHPDFSDHSDPTQTRFGIVLTVDATYHTSIWTGLDGYPEPRADDGDAPVDAHVTIGTLVELVTVDGTTNYVAGHPDTYMTEVAGTDIDISPPWWLTTGIVLVSFLFPPYGWVASIAALDGIIPGILDNAENLVTRQVAYGIDGAMKTLPTNRAQIATPLPGLAAPSYDITINDIVVSDQGIESYMTISADVAEPYLLYTDTIVTDPNTVTDAVASRGDLEVSVRDLGPITWVLKVPPGLVNALDPTVRVRWTVTRTDTGAAIDSRDVAMADAAVVGPLTVFTAVVDPRQPALMPVDSYDVHCQLYLALGGAGKDVQLADLHSVLTVLDWLDRHHPYVQWHHRAPIYAGVPQAHLMPEPPDPNKRWARDRTSRIHKTDYRQRCKATYAVRRRLDSPLRQYFDDLNSLPGGVTLAEIEADRSRARGILCDYCFYGGPTRTTLQL